MRTALQPGITGEACGISYRMFVKPERVTLQDAPFAVGPDQTTVP